MRRPRLAASLAALAVLASCQESTPPIPQDQADETVATMITGSTVDPNAQTTGGHTATSPAVTCTYNATTKWTTCGPTTHNGLTVTREMQFLDSAGNAQQRPDANTRSMKSKTTVKGTINVTHGTATGTTTVDRTSEETVTGLGPTSKQRVVNGTGKGTEDSELKDTRGTVTVKRQYSDTTKNLTFSSDKSTLSPWPLSGTIIRVTTATSKLNGGAEKTYTSRQEQTFASGGKVTIKTTVNGKTQTCTVQLGSKDKPVCT